MELRRNALRGLKHVEIGDYIRIYDMRFWGQGRSYHFFDVMSITECTIDQDLRVNKLSHQGPLRQGPWVYNRDVLLSLKGYDDMKLLTNNLQMDTLSISAAMWRAVRELCPLMSTSLLACWRKIWNVRDYTITSGKISKHEITGFNSNSFSHTGKNNDITMSTNKGVVVVVITMDA